MTKMSSFLCNPTTLPPLSLETSSRCDAGQQNWVLGLPTGRGENHQLDFPISMLQSTTHLIPSTRYSTLVLHGGHRSGDRAVTTIYDDRDPPFRKK